MDSMFIGTTPSFEMALYTYLYFAGEQYNNIQLGQHSVKVTVVRNKHGRLVTAFPAEL